MLPKQKMLFASSLLLAAPIVFAFSAGTFSFRKQDKPSRIENTKPAIAAKPAAPGAPRIQVALLLDVSSSMQGLIDQAKAQLWNLVSILGKAECTGGTPRIEIALYEYGRDSNPASAGYIKQLSPFSTDLDGLSKTLFSLATNGGDEYCPQVIFRSAKDLAWDTSATTYRAIFIAGNETFEQGKTTWMEACAAARAKGIVVNTIYCGDRQSGIQEHWNLGGECGAGSYTNISTNAQTEEIPTPYDSAIYTLNERLNGTMIGYGAQASYYTANVGTVDRMNTTFKASSGIKRAEVKANKKLYRNDSWEVVDAYETDSTIITKLDRKTLPDSLRKLAPKQLEAVVKNKLAERDAIRANIARISIERNNWLANERKNRISSNTEATLDAEIEKILRQQVQARGFLIR